MVVVKSNQTAEIVDMGVKYQMPLTIPYRKIWTAMVQKVYQPEKFLPVTDVKVIDIVHEHHVYREMVLMGRKLKEEIYFDKPNYKIRFVCIGEDTVHINVYHTDTRVLEYYQENEKGERTSWEAPKAFALKAMEKTKETAQEEMQKTRACVY